MREALQGEEAARVRNVLRRYGVGGAVRKVAQGWINETYEVLDGAAGHHIVQRLHPVFDAVVHVDIEAVTKHLQQQGLQTPRLVRTLDGSLWVEAEGIWRVLTFLEGRVFSTFESASQLRAAGALVGRFHRALRDLQHEFAFRRALVHDLDAHLSRLESVLSPLQTDPDAAAIALADEILVLGRALPPLPDLPTRVVHGDLKASNLLFGDEGPSTSALLDLDTLGRGDLATEMGDALRSWCNPVDEADARARLDADRFVAALEGYAESTRGWITLAEARAIPDAVERLAIELACRFSRDFFEDCYFGWDSARFASRKEHNLARARAQLNFAKSVSEQLAQLHAVDRAFG